MGTTLTGTTPQDTYDSLIKVTDNGPLSGTAKYLSDGLGNDSVLALSNARVGVATTSPSYPLTIVGDAGLEGNESYLYFHSTYSIGNNARARMRAVGAGGGSGYGGDLRIDTRATNNAWNADAVTINSSGNVGIGTSTPAQKLDVVGRIRLVTADYGVELLRTSDFFYSRLSAEGVDAYTNTNNAAPIIFKTGGSERVRIQAAGGISFNGDTAAANALDDYEEGTFSPTVIGTTTAGTATYVEQNGRYTKIGRLVQFEIYMTYSGGTGTGNLRIANLPFTIGGSAYASFSIGAFDNVTMTASNIPMAFGLVGSASIFLGEMPTGGGVVSAVAYDGAAGIQIAGTYSV